MKEVRTRFAPSPTGFLHVGGVRTALFAWLVAKQKNGQFFLRIEDTDKAREVEGSEQHIKDSLKWLGLDWNGEPYKQSEHLDNYREWAQKLIDKDRAYADPTTEEELGKLRQQAKAAKKPFLYREHRPASAGQRTAKWDGRQPLRFKSEPKDYKWQDEVMGDLSTGPEVVDDFIIMKSDGYPTYNFAHIIDDELMGITYVIRSQEFLASVPKFLNLYEALELELPKMATLPYVMGPGGNKKLSKRDGAKDVLDYKKEGYLAEALVNFLATLGWNDGTEQEIFTTQELVEKFDLNRVQRSGARFDDQRLKWTNGHFIRQLSLDKLYEEAKDFWPPEASESDEKEKKRVLSLVQERLKFFAELPELTKFFFVDLPVNPELISSHKQLSKLSKEELKSLLEQSKDVMNITDFNHKALNDALNDLLEKTGQKPAVLFSLIRIATTQAPASPELAPTLEVLGKDRTLERLQKQIAAL